MFDGGKGGFAGGVAGYGGSVEPGALDDAGFGVIGEAGFVAVQLADEHIDGGGADEMGVLAHAGPIEEIVVTVEMGEGEGGGDFYVHLLDPCFDLVVEGEDGVGLVLLVPGAEGGFAGLVEGEGWDVAAIGEVLVGGPEARGEAAPGDEVGLGVYDEADAAGAVLPEVLDGVEGGGELVVGGEVEGGPCGAHADDDAGEALADEVDLLREAGAIEEGGDDEAADAAGLEDACEARGADAGLVKPEGVEAVTEFCGAVVAAFDPGVEGGEAGEGLGIRGDVEEAEGGLVLGGAAGAQLCHECGDGGVGAVAHFCGELLDAAACLGAEAGVVAKGEGDGGFADACALGDFVHRGGGCLVVGHGG